MSALPREWREATLSEVARWGSGGTPAAGDRRYYGGDIPWAVIADLNDGVVTSTAKTITDDGLNASAAKWVPPGAVLVAMYGSIGKLGTAGIPMTTNQAIAFAVPGPDLDGKFLFYYLMSQRPQLDAQGKGATQRNISQTILKPWAIPLPFLAEQRRIVEILEDHLSRLDAANTGLRAAQVRVAAMRRSALDQLFGLRHPAATVGEFVSNISAGKSFGTANAPATPDQWGIIRVSAMTWGEFDPSQNKAVDEDNVDPRFEIRPGDLLVSRANTNEYVGASVLVADVRPRLLLSDKSLRLTPAQGIHREWLWRALQAPSARRQISGLATGTKDSMRNISQSSLRAIRIPVATEAEQLSALSAFDEVESACLRLADAATLQMTRSSALRRAVLAAAFEGKLTGRHTDTDVIEEAASTEGASR